MQETTKGSAVITILLDEPLAAIHTNSDGDAVVDVDVLQYDERGTEQRTQRAVRYGML